MTALNEISLGSLIFISVVVFLYNYSLFSLAKKALLNVHSGTVKTLVFSVINTLLFLYFFGESRGLLFLYFALFITFFFEFLFMSFEDIFDIFFLVNAVMINVMSILSITICVYAWSLDVFFYYIIYTPKHYLHFFFLSLFILIFLTTFVAKCFGQQHLRGILNNKVHRVYLFIYFLVVNIYFLYNAQAYTAYTTSSFTVTNQFLASLVFLFSFFYMISYAVKTNGIMDLVEKNSYYKAELVNQQKIMSNFIQNASIKFDLNLTEDTILSGFDYNDHVLIEPGHSYTDTLSRIAEQLIHPDHQESFKTALSPDKLLARFKDGTNILSFEFLQKNNENESSFYWYRTTLSMIEDGLTGDIKVIAYMENIDEEKKRHTELAQKAQLDSLSGLNNKEHTRLLIERQLRKGEGVLYLIDIDNFKSINDSMGHGMGDEVLRALSSDLKRIFRGEDIVGRIGGDEFMVYVSTGLPDRIATQKAEQVMDAFLNTYTDMEGQDHIISSSIGIYIVDTDTCQFEDIYHKADIAMYQTKKNGKNGYTVYNGEEFSTYVSDRTKEEQ